jgi:lysyl-tRNA synthetase class 2
MNLGRAFTIKPFTIYYSQIAMTVPFLEENDQTVARRAHLESLRALVGNVYPNKFERSDVTGTVAGEDTVSSIVLMFGAYAPQVGEGERPSQAAVEAANSQLAPNSVRIAGRMIAPPRLMGKAAFFHLTDGSLRLQIYVRSGETKGVNNSYRGLVDELRRADYPDVPSRYVDGWRLFNLLDQGDFVGVEGQLFITKAGELSLRAESLQFLSKALQPMPSKVRGISSAETRQRQRYADLIAGSLIVETKGSAHSEKSALNSRQVFELRARVIKEIRSFLEQRGYIEVETPMLTSLATGAAARPFKTYHNALGIPLYARIAPELYLKRLLVGGFEKVYELNRNFRNEGIDRQHNPEFTMLEYYWAYADVNQMMDLHEEMMRSVVETTTGGLMVRYGDYDIDFSKPFQRVSMAKAASTAWRLRFQYCVGAGEITEQSFKEPNRVAFLAYFLKLLGLESLEMVIEAAYIGPEKQKRLQQDFALSWERANAHQAEIDERARDSALVAEDLVYLFEQLAEPNLIQPTFITDFPKPISPLSKASPADPSFAERFEYFVGALESANGFSELNDPEEQYQRFKEQTRQRERGNEEAMTMDEDYIRALSYGMPPAAGIGVGIDRLVMLLANKQSIRDVILFPHMRPKKSWQHQFLWLKPLYEELIASDEWNELDENEKAKRLVRRFEQWISEPDSPPNRKTLFGEKSEDMHATAKRALALIEG